MQHYLGCTSGESYFYINLSLTLADGLFVLLNRLHFFNFNSEPIIEIKIDHASWKPAQYKNERSLNENSEWSKRAFWYKVLIIPGQKCTKRSEYDKLKLDGLHRDHPPVWTISNHISVWINYKISELSWKVNFHFKVHHSGEDFNLAASMRQSLFQRFFTWPFYLPLAVLGIPPQFFLMHMGLNLMYQFWIHTELIDGFGPVFNYFFNTPKPWSQNTFFRYFIF